MVKQFEVGDVIDFGMQRKEEIRIVGSIGAVETGLKVENYNTILRGLSHFNEAVTAKEIADWLNENEATYKDFDGIRTCYDKKWNSHIIGGMMVTLWNMGLIENGIPIEITGERRAEYNHHGKKYYVIPIYEINTYKLAQ